MLVQNVFLTGGNMMYPGMKVRIEKELLEMRPFQSSFQVLIVHGTSCFEKSIKYLFSDCKSNTV